MMRGGNRKSKINFYNVDLPYCLELELIVEKKHHTLDPTIVHLLKKSKWTKRFSLKICPKKIHIHASPTVIVANRQTVGIKRSRWARLKN
uniref:Uncharacterized protein n=1 Tax=Oryza barthii TaxID=65489 RepID=A0A0D3GS58_9ORYZ